LASTNRFPERVEEYEGRARLDDIDEVVSTWNRHVSDVTDGVVRNARSLSFHRDSFKRGYATCDDTGTVDATGDRIQCVCLPEARTTFDLRRQ
jgi:hypothetical protein